MATPLLGLALPTTGSLTGFWGATVNNSITSLLDSAVAGTTTLSTDGDVTLTTTIESANQARQAIILWTAAGTVTRYITAPAHSKTYIVINASGTQSIVLRGAGPTTGVTIIAGEKALCAWNGSDFVKLSSSTSSGTVTSVGFTGGLISVGTPTTTPAFTVAGTSGGVVYFANGNTWASSGALAANALVVGGGAGAAPATVTTGSGVVTALGVNTGAAGAFVVNGGALGTPSSGTVTNLTGTASIYINGTVGATTANTGTFTSTVYNGSSSGAITITAPAVAGTQSYTLPTGLPAVSGYALTSTTGGAMSWAPVSGGSGVSTISIATANGFAGTSSGGATPTLTLTTSVSGIVKGSGSALVSATAGTDYLSPPSGAAILKANSGGALANATAGTDYLAPPSGAAILKANSGGALANAVANTDYQSPITLTTTGSSGAATFNGVTLNIPQYSGGGGGGTVTSVGGTGTVSGLTLSGTVTTSGNLTLGGSITGTGSGSVVLQNSPSLITPALGTPASGNLANCTFPTLNQNTNGSALTFTSTSQNSQFNSIGVGTAASATAGEIRATNNITAYYSDDRLKTRLGNVENALDKVTTLDAFYYEANEVAQGLGYEPVREVGISAQQVQMVIPEVVAPAPIDEKYLTVRYERLVPLLIAAIKELKAEVEVLKGVK